MSLLNWIDFHQHGDNRGSLVALEENKDIPFNIKRIYYIYNTKQGVSRGFHAHKNLHQVAISLSGKCKIILDNGILREETWLDSPDRGLIINDMTWREMHDFSSDCVLLVLASEYYDENDYIRNYQDFIKCTEI